MSDANPSPLSEEEALELAESAAANSGTGSGSVRKARNFGPSFKRMLGLLSPYWVRLAIVTVLGAASVVMSVAAPKVLARATDIIFGGYISRQLPAGVTAQQAVEGLKQAGQDQMAAMLEKMDVTPGAGIDFTALAHVILTVIVLYVGASALSWAQGYILNRVMVRAMWKLREDVEDKINRLPLAYFDKARRGDLISRVTNDIENITTTLQQSLSGAMTNIFTVVGVLVMMLTISWKLTLMALISLPMLAIIFGLIGPKSQKAFALQWMKVGRLNTRVEESFSGQALVKVFGQQKAFEEEFAKENQELYEASYRAQVLSGLMMPSMSFVGNVVYVGIAVVGGVMVASGTMLLGSVQAFIQYAQQFNQPLAQLGGMATSVQSGVASAERVFELLDAPDQSPDNPDAPASVLGNGRIEFENVKFSYDPQKPLIRDLSFTVEPGQKVAIVGPTGAGKTTLVNLLMRFYELDGGKIKIDGQDIAELARDDARERTAMVLQDPWLFSGTIKENIRYGNPAATDDQIVAAAKATRVDHLVRQLPEGYETFLEEDASNMSAGERQLLTIARAFVADPSVLILDEATSSVDTRTERMLQQAMAKLQEERTSFVIAHRLSTIRDADLILMMENGDIVEKGTHDELIAKKGAYWRLYNSQFQGGADLDDQAVGNA